MAAPSPHHKKLDVVFKAQPIAEDVFTASAHKVDVSPLVGHGVRIVHAPCDLDRVVELMHLFRRGAVDDDHDVTGCAMRPPEPVAVVTTDGCRQTASEEVNRAGLAVV